MHPQRHVWGRPLPRDCSAFLRRHPPAKPQDWSITDRPSAVTWLGFAPHRHSDDARSPGLSPLQCRSTGVFADLPRCGVTNPVLASRRDQRIRQCIFLGRCHLTGPFSRHVRHAGTCSFLWPVPCPRRSWALHPFLSASGFSRLTVSGSECFHPDLSPCTMDHSDL